MEENNQENLPEYRGNKKFNFKEKKNNTIKSLKEVECFLWNWKRASKGIDLYKLLKK